MVTAPSQPEPTAGADVGATLVKLALRDASGHTITDALPAGALDEAVERLAAHAAGRVGLTGGGARQLAERVAAPSVRVGEFEAWAAGARSLLEREGGRPERFLLVSVGTGTSATLVEPGAVTRVGGSALGGGTLLGLGAALCGVRDYAALVRLAERGDRSRVDLRVADIDPDGDLALPGALNAASFAKLARAGASAPEPADLAQALIGLVGENLGLICASLAARFEVRRVVFGGFALPANPTLTAILGGVCAALGREPCFPPDGHYAGALGALALAARAQESAPRRVS